MKKRINVVLSTVALLVVSAYHVDPSQQAFQWDTIVNAGQTITKYSPTVPVDALVEACIKRLPGTGSSGVAYYTYTEIRSNGQQFVKLGGSIFGGQMGCTGGSFTIEAGSKVKLFVSAIGANFNHIHEVDFN